MSEHQYILKKGFKFIFGAIPLFFLAPILINIGFSAIKKDQNYIFICIGFVLAILGIALIFIGLKHVLNFLFLKDRES
jgi:NADH:ubiquinone oxidoreductase subunit K